MDKNLNPPFVPVCPRNIAIVDQYQYDYEDKDYNRYQCMNGISDPIYSCNGQVAFSLPLENWPPGDDLHPQVHLMSRYYPKFNFGGSQPGWPAKEARRYRENYKYGPTPPGRPKSMLPCPYGTVAGSCADWSA